ncbi:MAG: FxsA family protein [Tropicimonas sp.]|uniref:FxsA family protein n=1 Tax=Tropicimonas sp. TaxID=2067044 RepID=UPI003A83F9C1
MPLLLLFILIPLIEITLFIQLGSILDLGWILLGVVLSAVLGSWLVRQQGRGVLAQLQQSLNQLDDPTEPLAHGAMLILSGALLITPGFFTDTLGFLLLIPKVRERVFRWLRARVVLHSSVNINRARTTRPARPGGSADVIDGDFTEIPTEPRRSKGPSGWTQD